MTEPPFFSRDISWLSFNQRVLLEADRAAVPVGERFRFLSIFSSNLDEFYRVRMPVLMAKHQLSQKKTVPQPNHGGASSEYDTVRQVIGQQQEQFGQILNRLIPLLSLEDTVLIYRVPIPASLHQEVHDFFFSILSAYLQPQLLTTKTGFFPENNRLYLLVSVLHDKEEALMVVNIPSEELPRFFTVDHDGKQYIVFIDDILKLHLPTLFAGKQITGAYSFKITRDAALELDGELPDSEAEKIEKLIASRDQGLATRLLHEPGLPLRHIQLLSLIFRLSIGNAMEGGVYHNLRDMADLPLKNKRLFFPVQPPIVMPREAILTSLFEEIGRKDIVVHAPYQSYGLVLRFFNEAAIDPDVDEIFVTLYRIARDSRIAHALMSAARNGKKVMVFVELKARFDEANNIKWSRRMKEAGVKVVYSIPALKVHAKIALVKKGSGRNHQYYGLLATGNLNESTARFYTDHILLTAHTAILHEMELLFLFLSNRKKPEKQDSIRFDHLLVAQFNLQQRFLSLIDAEIAHVKNGQAGSIIIKLNNLEEQMLIGKLYEASRAGVHVQLIVRSICCLVPGVPGLSERITVRRIVGRYLEHGRVFVFGNGGAPLLFMGSADWMNRNIYTRIEVCFPVYDEQAKQEILRILDLQLHDNTQAVQIGRSLDNIPVHRNQDQPAVDSQAGIYEMLRTNTNHDV